METAAPPPAPPTSLTGAQMPVRVAGSCGCARVAEIFSAKVVQHICVSEDPAKFQQVVRMLEQKATVAKVSLVPFVVSALLCACPSARPPRGLPTCADAAGLALRAIGYRQMSLRPRRTPSTLLAEAAPAG